MDLGFADTGDLAVLDAAARRAKYVQWDEVLPAVPELIDDAARLAAAADELGAGPRAFDVEWSDRAGAALLQLATKEGAVILDVPRLCASREGCAALRRRVPGRAAAGLRLLAGPRAAPRDAGGGAVGRRRPGGLRPADGPDPRRGGPRPRGRGAAVRLGKALDKSRAVADWDARPLSEAQRAYAALDAVAVLLIHEKLRSVDDAIVPSADPAEVGARGRQCEKSRSRRGPPSRPGSNPSSESTGAPFSVAGRRRRKGERREVDARRVRPLEEARPERLAAVARRVGSSTRMVPSSAPPRRPAGRPRRAGGAPWP